MDAKSSVYRIFWILQYWYIFIFWFVIEFRFFSLGKVGKWKKKKKDEVRDDILYEPLIFNQESLETQILF